MHKWLKRSGFALVTLLLIAIVGGAIFILNFDPKVYQERLVQEVKLRYERDLEIKGDVELSLFPRIGLRVTDVSLSEKNSSEEFSTMEEVRFAVALWPLLFDRFLVDNVYAKGLKTHVVRYPDGTLNIDDFYALPHGFTEEQLAHRRRQAEFEVGAESDASSRITANEMKVDIAGLILEEGQILFEDKGSNTQFSLEHLNIHTGRITFGEPFALNLTADVDSRHADDQAQLSVRSMVRLDPSASIYQVDKLNATLQGQLQGYKLEQASLNGTFSLDNFANYVDGQAARLLLDLRGLESSNRFARVSVAAEADVLGVNRLETHILAEQFKLQGALTDFAERTLTWQLNSTNFNLSSFDAAGAPLTGTVQFEGEENMRLDVSFDGFSGLASQLEVRENTLKGQYITMADRTIDVDFSSPLALNLLSGDFAYQDLRGMIHLSEGELFQRVPVEAELKGNIKQALFEFKADAFLDSELMSLTGTLEGFSQSQINFNLRADSLALDRLIERERVDVETVEAASSNVVASDSSSTTAEEVVDPSAEEVAQESSLKQARSLTLEAELLSRLSGLGTLNIGTLSYGDLVLDALDTTVIFDSSRDIRLESLRAQVFGGELSADSNFSFDTGAFTVNAKLNDVPLEQLLQALKSRPVLSGQADLDINLSSRGLTQQERLAQLDGAVHMNLHNGELRGLDLNHYLDDLDYLLDTGSSQFHWDMTAHTPFKVFDLETAIDKGVLHVDSLAIEGEEFTLTDKSPVSRYYLESGDYDVNLQLSVQRPVTMVKEGVRVQVKGLSVPLHIWNVDDAVELRVTTPSTN